MMFHQLGDRLKNKVRHIQSKITQKIYIKYVLINFYIIIATYTLSYL